VPTPTSPPAPVLADIHERASHVPDVLAELGVQVEVVPLPAGDYAVGPAILVERKSLPDLHETILKGRFWQQIDRLRRASEWPFLLVEGQHLDDGPIAPKAIRGVCVAAIARGIRLIRTEDRHDSAMWLHALALRVGRTASTDRPVYAQRPKPNGAKEAAEAVLAAVPGISTTCARALLQHFGSVAAVAAAGPTAWLEVPGIGPERARSLEETFSFRPAHATPPAADPRVHRDRLST
jgi:ERCC4-type nuclease